ncbi:MAG: orotate phosphoribosyltransferase [Proteobacteria bacterium]|nr:orotate phosphoribosyltransferase [Burkholderiales bacterium]MCA0310579.1 orotate phosphoribosyltransferase [Pseudomonadota bacterium]
MPLEDQPTSRDVAAWLLEAGCVSARTAEPFRLPSGWASPVYMDCRRLISFPTIRRAVVALALRTLQSAGALDGVTSIAGAETSGIALAAWMAHELELPLQYVRKKAIGHTLIEGVIKPGDRVLLVDDVMAAGQSKARFLRTLTDAGAIVKDVFVVFDYGTFNARDALLARGVRVHALATWQDILAVAGQRRDLPRSGLDELTDFLQDTAAWSVAHGGVGISPAFN